MATRRRCSGLSPVAVGRLWPGEKPSGVDRFREGGGRRPPCDLRGLSGRRRRGRRGQCRRYEASAGGQRGCPVRGPGRGPRPACRCAGEPRGGFFFLGDVRRCLAQVRSRWGNVADLTVVKEIRFTPVTAKGGVRWNLNLTRLTISGTPFA